MKILKILILSTLTASSNLRAELVPRLGGLAFYDTILDITWLANANLAATNAYGIAGIGFYEAGDMTSITASQWITALNADGGTGYLGFNDWRLPATAPVNELIYNYTLAYDGTADRGYNLSALDTLYAGSTAIEMAHLFYTTLGNTGWYTTAGVRTDCSNSIPYNCLTVAAPFSNIQPGSYWTNEVYQSNTDYRFGFDVTRGYQNGYFRNEYLFVWPVRDGDVAFASVAADLNTDNLINSQDYILLRSALTAPDIIADISQDGSVSGIDYSLLRENFILSATNDAFSTAFGVALSGSLATNDTASVNSPTNWELISQASSGMVTVNADGSFSYSPLSGFSGQDSFAYRMRDALNNISNTATVQISVQPRLSLSSCDTLYANNGGYTPLISKTLLTVPATPKPLKGEHYIDVDYGTCIVRVSDYVNDSSTIANRIVPDYSRRQVFNADQSRMLLLASDGYWHLYSATDYSHIRRVSLQGDSVEFQWHPTNPDLLYRMAYNGGLKIYLHDVSDPADNTFTVAADLTRVASINGYPGFTSINQVWPNAVRFLTGEEGSPSKDGRYWALMGMSADFNTQYGILVYDMQSNTIAGVYDYATDGKNSAGNVIGGPNNVSMSPSGTHVVVSWNPPACDGNQGRPLARGTLNNPCGSMAFNRDFTVATGLTVNGEHGDTATDINGRDVLVSIEYQNQGAIEIIDLETGNLLSEIENQMWNGAVHISGRAVNKPGWVVISHYVGTAANVWYNEEIFLAKLEVNPVIVRLAKHRSNAADYWAQPHATIGRDASKIVWGSNWGGEVLDLDTYMLVLPTAILDQL